MIHTEKRNNKVAIRNIITEGDDTLRKKSKPVTEFNEKLHILLDDMGDTLKKANGVGLAAVQIGVLRRIYIIDIGIEEGKNEIIEFINPEIIKKQGKQEEAEGCLSVPGKYGITSRPAKVTVRAQNRNGEFFEYTGEGIFARCLCHEYDHLDGILYTDNAIEMLDPDDFE